MIDKSDWLSMTLEQLRIFVAVAERLHMTRAAEVLRLTQSAVSAAIAALEARHGPGCSTGWGRGTALNATGAAFLPEARAVLAPGRGGGRVLDDLAGLKRGAVRLFASQTIAAYWLLRMAAFARQRHPTIDLHLDIGNTHRVVEAVLARRRTGPDRGGRSRRRGSRRVRIDADRLVVVAAPGHPLAGRSEALSAAELKAGLGLARKGVGHSQRVQRRPCRAASRRGCGPF